MDFRNEVVIFPSTKHQGNYYWLVDLATRLPIDASDCDLGGKAIEAFSRCRTGPRDPVGQSSFTPIGAPTPFGYKIGWIAIRTTDQTKVGDALSLQNSRPATWDEGVKGAYGRDAEVFMTPPVKGWTIVLGYPVMAPGPSLEPLLSLLRRLSTLFGEVQAFGTHRVSEYHYWALAKGGKIRRAYAFAGDEGRLLLNVGRLTPGEIHAIGVPCRGWAPSEEDVMNIAGRWSINPSVAADGDSESECGVIGVMEQRV